MNAHANPPAGETDRLLQLAKDLKKFELDITRALEYSYGSYTISDVIGGILQGRFHFYAREHSFLICEVERGPQYNVYHAFLAGGLLSELMEMQEMIRPIAKTLGCKYASLNGREGWERPLKAIGWQKRYTVLYNEV